MDFEMVDGSPNLAADTELTLESWLEALGMSEFLSPFQDQGFDLHLIRAQGLDEEDLAAIGITKRGYIKKLIAAAKALSQAPKAAPRAASGPFSADHSQLPALLDFCTQNMMVTVDHQRACNYLDLAIKFGEEALQGICLDFIERHTLEVMSSEGFLGLSPKGVEIILQSPALNIEEVVLFQALLRWKTGDSAHRDLAPFVKYIRFGAMSAGDLFKIVEPLGVATPEQLLAAYRFHSCPEFKAACNTPFFTPRKKTGSGVPSVSGNAAASSVSNVFPIPSKGAAWTLTMSSKYSGLPNTYETLIDEHPNQPGAATNSGQNQWIQATFEQPVIVQKVIVSAPSKGAFELQGWGGPSSAQSYLVGAEVQCSMDEKNWETIRKLDLTAQDGFLAHELKEPKIGKYFRLLRPNGYIATGSMIFE